MTIRGIRHKQFGVDCQMTTLAIPVNVPHKTVLGIINTLICIGQLFQVVSLYVNELCLPESKLIGNDSEDLAASSHVR
ncbi:unnamed protein product [Schistosoma margrebowiei]|uniref:Uncharacterized protein n=1 Tax=Schistosoma margrebowiei TaxID=48269 RepID=A0AA85AC15_9TREM|nr:unnamed protein product [Schistosoma margrebowiei]